MKSALPRPTWAALAALALIAQAQAQTPAPAPADPQKLETITVTGSLIKRTDKETPSVVQSISRKDIANSGYANIEELLRSTSAVDASSITDGAGTGFVSGLATISLRGFGSQGTLVLINGRRLAPVAAVDINFGRGSLISVNSIPRGAIDRIDILKDGASALYGSDAMAGVVNYILRKDYEGIEANAGYTASDEGVGKVLTGGFSFGFGNLDSKGFNVFGGLEVSKRDPVMHSELKGFGDLETYNRYLNTGGVTSRFTPDSNSSFHPNYYRVPPSLAGSSVVNGASVANNSPQGINYLGNLGGCEPENTVGQGVPNRPAGFLSTTPSLINGQCRFNFDNADEAISKQDRVSAVMRATLALGSDFTGYADLMLSKTETAERMIPQTLTTGLVTSGNPVAVTWARLDGTLVRQNAIILPTTHPDNPTRTSTTPIPVQLLYRFVDLAPYQTQDLDTKRLTVGVEGSAAGWDIDSAVMYSRQDNVAAFRNRLKKSLLDASLTPGSASFGQYRFGGTNSDAAKATVAGDAIVNGESTITSADVRGSRELFEMSGGAAAVAVGLEFRRETLDSVPAADYQSADFVGLVGNGAGGSRNLWAAFSEFRLPVLKTLELQAAARYEKYSDFGNATTGKLGFKWDVMPSTLVLRGTVATGFRAPSIAQISDAFLLSFHNFQERAVADPIRCPNGVSLSNPTNSRDCNVLGRTATTPNPGSIPSIITANPDLKPEKSRSATAGIVFQPNRYMDLALDAWYFERNDEIRVQRGVDVMDNYIRDQAAYASSIIRDPNPTTWLPGVADSGPIIAIRRGYGNYKWSKTSGIDYDLNLRMPAMEIGRVSFKLAGTYTARFDQLVLEGAPIDRWAGTSSSGVPTSKATASVRLDRDTWSIWGRYNHEDPLRRIGVTEACRASTSATNVIRKGYNGCVWTALRTIDMGFSVEPMKGMTIAGALLNVTNDSGRSTDVPSSFTYWDSGNPSSLGRRVSLSVSYAMD